MSSVLESGSAGTRGCFVCSRTRALSAPNVGRSEEPWWRRIFGTSAPAATPAGQVKGKGKGKGKGKAAPPPPPKKSEPQPVLDVPTWEGPRPDEGLKAERIVQWQPIRQAGLLSGSVWEDVHRQLLHEDVVKVDTPRLKSAFMKTINETEPVEASEESKRIGAVRCTLLSKPLSAEILHANLVRQGFCSTNKLDWVMGKQPPTSSQSSQTSWSAKLTRMKNSSAEDSANNPSANAEIDADDDSEDVYETAGVALHQNALETLLNLYILAVGCEPELLNRDTIAQPLAPVEDLLRQLMMEGGPLPVLQGRAEALLYMSRFASEAQELQKQFRAGIAAADSVVQSSTMPKFLGCVLLIGNYVNSASNALGGALGVTLESLAKLGNTRCLQSGDKSARSETALTQVIRKLDEAQGPFFLSVLVSELEPVRSANSLDVVAMQGHVVKLASQIAMLDERAGRSGDCEPRHLQPNRLGKFLEKAKPQMEALQDLSKKLDVSIESLRQYFAEPHNQSFKNMIGNLTMFLERLPSQAPSAQEERPRAQTPLKQYRRQSTPTGHSAKPAVPSRRLKTKKDVRIPELDFTRAATEPYPTSPLASEVPEISLPGRSRVEESKKALFGKAGIGSRASDADCEGSTCCDSLLADTASLARTDSARSELSQSYAQMTPKHQIIPPMTPPTPNFRPSPASVPEVPVITEQPETTFEVIAEQPGTSFHSKGSGCEWATVD